jgi:protein SCO1/2/putative membrane protein
LALPVFVVAFGLLLAARVGHAQEQKAVWDPAGVEDFSLTECHGQTVTKADLLGKPWVACFIFTRCAGPCPRVSEQMQILQKRLKGIDVRLVSFSVDPDRDTPEDLRKYAEFYKADPERWWFLTGDKATIFRLIRKSFRMIVDDDPEQTPGFEVIHSIEILHVDAEGVVRGRYDARDDVDMAKLRRVLLGKSDAIDAKLIREGEDRERRRLKALALAQKDARATPSDGAGTDSGATGDWQARLAAESTGKDAPRSVPAWVLRLPAVNASLNGLATILLVAGWVLIKSNRQREHKVVMLTAFCTSAVFLACYVVYHFQLRYYTGSGSQKFQGTGAIQMVYFPLLISHILLAIGVAILAPVTLYRGLTNQLARHKRLARVTLPIWLYVSVTGVIIYVMLYHWPVVR